MEPTTLYLGVSPLFIFIIYAIMLLLCLGCCSVAVLLMLDILEQLLKHKNYRSAFTSTIAATAFLLLAWVFGKTFVLLQLVGA